MRGVPSDLIGKTYGRLTVVSLYKRIKGVTYWKCTCQCGADKVLRASNLGSTRSCGCLREEGWKTLNKIHGEAPGKTKEYRTWKGIKTRAKSSNETYKNISVCKRWMESYDAFLDDMGRAPSPKHSLDRINSNGNYEPGNCRWATSHEQINNRRITRRIEYNGEIKTLKEWADHFNLNYTSLHGKIYRRGNSLEQVLTKLKII